MLGRFASRVVSEASMAIRNPVEWGANGLSLTASAVRSALGPSGDEARVSSFEVRRIGLSDLEVALRQGWDDFLAYRTDVIFICFIYPLAGLIVARASFDLNKLPLLFPLISGFALIAPCAAAGLYEMSRLRERGREVSWTDAFAVFRSTAIVSGGQTRPDPDRRLSALAGRGRRSLRTDPGQIRADVGPVPDPRGWSPPKRDGLSSCSASAPDRCSLCSCSPSAPFPSPF